MLQQNRVQGCLPTQLVCDLCGACRHSKQTEPLVTGDKACGADCPPGCAVVKYWLARTFFHPSLTVRPGPTRILQATPQALEGGSYIHRHALPGSA